MAKARAKGRPIAPLELSAEERTYLERQSHQKAAPARRSYLGQAPASRHPCPHRPVQPKPQALQMDQVRRSNLASVKRFCQRTQKTLCSEL
jgi:hypothetical protein